MALSEIKLGSTVESVEALGRCGKNEFRLVVVADVLVSEFGAGAGPQSWLETFKAHAATIEHRAVQSFETSGKSLVLIYKSRQPRPTQKGESPLSIPAAGFRLHRPGPTKKPSSDTG